MRQIVIALCCLLALRASALAASLQPVTATASQPIAAKLPDFPIFGGGGHCVIDFTIQPDGTVLNAHVADCYPRGYFESASLKAAATWLFQPAAGPSAADETPARAVLTYVTPGVRTPIPASENDYLKPGQWVSLKYTLDDEGIPEHVKVVAQSDPEVQTRHAIQQIRFSQFAPATLNGRAVEKPDQEIRLSAGAAPDDSPGLATYRGTIFFQQTNDGSLHPGHMPFPIINPSPKTN